MPVPIGHRRRRHGYAMPYVQRRGAWEAMGRAGVRRPRDLGPYVGQCSHCKLRIGRLYRQTELYLYPVPATKGRLGWKVLCGGCAVEDFELPFGCCLVAARDWQELPWLATLADPAWRLAKEQLLHLSLEQVWLQLRKQAPRQEWPAALLAAIVAAVPDPLTLSDLIQLVPTDLEAVA